MSLDLEKCHYHVLGVELTEDATQLKNAYRKMALKVSL